MSIIEMHVVGDGPQGDIGNALKVLSQSHVRGVDGVSGIGFSFDNCNAAVAVDRQAAAAQGYVTAGTHTEAFNAIFGSSRLYGGLDPSYNSQLLDWQGRTNPFSNSYAGQHAEQTAILLAESLGIPFWVDGGDRGHLYVDFSPCDKCEPWLRAHPFPWVVHYGVPLSEKATFTRGRKQRSRDTKKEVWSKLAIKKTIAKKKHGKASHIKKLGHMNW